ncbi:MAG: Uma2 family endonuclease [Anaerolineae bacterium]|nr:Uma2 family endonuclease [Anaerolineae bacterium]
MAIAAPPVTAEAFEHLAALPENAEKRLELVGGEIIELVSNSYCSIIASRINGFLFIYLLANPIGHLTAPDGGYAVGQDRVMPDVGFITKARCEKAPRETWVSLAPDLAVEIISPSDRPKTIATKVTNYLAAGTVVWLVAPDDQTVTVYRPGQPAQTFGAADMLDGDDLLPGFTLAVKDIFPDE